MRTPKLALAALLPLAVVAGACSDDEATDDPDTVEAGDDTGTDTGTGDDAGDTGDDTSEDTGDDTGDDTGGGPADIEISMSTGAGTSAAATECTIDGTNATVQGDDGNFHLDVVDGAAELHWTHDDGELVVSGTAFFSDSTITMTGMTDDGSGYNVQVNC